MKSRPVKKRVKSEIIRNAQLCAIESLSVRESYKILRFALPFLLLSFTAAGIYCLFISYYCQSSGHFYILVSANKNVSIASFASYMHEQFLIHDGQNIDASEMLQCRREPLVNRAINVFNLQSECCLVEAQTNSSGNSKKTKFLAVNS